MKKTSKVLALVLCAACAFSPVACAAPETTHKHTYSTEYSYDATKHWREATCEHTDEITGFGTHVFGDDDECDVCGYNRFTDNGGNTPDDGGNGGTGGNTPDDGGNGGTGGNTPDDGGNGGTGGNTPDDGGNGGTGGNTPDDGGNGGTGGNTPDDGGNGGTGGNTPDDGGNGGTGGNTPDDGGNGGTGGNTPDDGGNDEGGNTPEQDDILDVVLPSYTPELGATYGDLPDVPGVKIDGNLNDGIWTDANRKWYTNNYETLGVQYTYATHFSNKGLYIAARSVDSSIMWNGKNYFDYNTNFSFYIASKDTVSYDASVRKVAVDANNIYPGRLRVNAVSKVNGGAVNSGESTGLAVEMFITWNDLRIGVATQEGSGTTYSKPDAVLVNAVYRHVNANNGFNSVGTNVRGTLSYNVTDMKNYIKMNANGYAAYDVSGAVLGNSPTGTAKSAAWDLSELSGELDSLGTGRVPGTENVKTTASNFQALFFTDAHSERFIATTRIKPNGSYSSAKAGIISFKDNLNYRTATVDVSSANINSDYNLTYDRVYATTHRDDGSGVNYYVTNVGGGNSTSAGTVSGVPRADKITVIKDGKNFRYLVNDVFVASETVDALSGAVSVGLYADVPVKFTDYEFTDYEGTAFDAAFTAATRDYFYSVDATVNLAAGGTIVSDTSAVKAGLNKYANFTVLTNPGYTLESITAIDAYGAERTVWSETDRSSSMTGTVFTYLVEQQLTIRANFRELGASESVNVDIRAHLDGDETTRAANAQIRIIACDSSNNMIPGYQVNTTLDANGEGRFKLIRGYKLYFDVRADGFRLWNGFVGSSDYDQTYGSTLWSDLLDDETTEDYYEGCDVAMKLPVVGGSVSCNEFTVNSQLDGWDLSNEHNNVVTYTSSITNPDALYFTGLADTYAVAEITVRNVINPSDYSNYEHDPTVGIIIENGDKSTVIALRQRGLRIIKNNDWNNGRIEEQGLLSYKTVDEIGKDVKLKVVRANEMYFVYVDDVHVYTHADDNFVQTYGNLKNHKKTAFGLYVGTTYTSSIEFKDYSCVVGDDAREYVAAYHHTQVQKTGNAASSLALSGSIETSGGVTNAVKGSSINAVMSMYSSEAVVLTVSSNGASDEKYLLTIDHNGVNFTARDADVTTVNAAYMSASICRVSGRIDSGSTTLVNPVFTAKHVSSGAIKSVTVNADGTFSTYLPVGDYVMSVSARGCFMTEFNVTVSNGQTDIGTFKISEAVFGGSVDVDGKTWNSVANVNSASGGYQYPGRMSDSNNNFTLYVNGALGDNPVGTEYAFGYTVRINAKNANSPYYANDHVMGLAIVTNEKQLNILVLNSGFRVMIGGWNQVNMIETESSGWDFWRDGYGTGADEYAEVTMSAYRRNNVIYVFMQSAIMPKTLYLTVDPVNGVTPYGNGGNHAISSWTSSHMNSLKTHLRTIFFESDGTTPRNNGLGYNAQMEHANSTNTNSAMVFNATYGIGSASVDAMIATDIGIVNDTSQGSVSFSGEGYVADNKFVAGKSITITATARTGYNVTAIKVNGVTQPITVGAVASATVTAGAEFNVEIVYSDSSIVLHEVKIDASRAIRNNTVKIMGSKDGATAVAVDFVLGSDSKFAVNVEAGEWVFTAYNSADDTIATASVTVSNGGANNGTFNAV